VLADLLWREAGRRLVVSIPAARVRTPAGEGLALQAARRREGLVGRQRRCRPRAVAGRPRGVLGQLAPCQLGPLLAVQAAPVALGRDRWGQSPRRRSTCVMGVSVAGAATTRRVGYMSIHLDVI
jgi:hypothetical protein